MELGLAIQYSGISWNTVWEEVDVWHITAFINFTVGSAEQLEVSLQFFLLPLGPRC